MRDVAIAPSSSFTHDSDIVPERIEYAIDLLMLYVQDRFCATSSDTEAICLSTCALTDPWPEVCQKMIA